jgi:uncharacterized protein DUF5906
MDHIAAPVTIDPVTDPDGAIEHLIGLLPPELADGSCWWQWTSSQSLPGHEDTLSARLWYRSVEPLCDADLKRWAATANGSVKLIDIALYSPVQAHYIAAPIFDGMTDPLPRRYGVRAGLEDEVSLILPPPDPKNPEMAGGQGYAPGRGVQAFLAEIGGGRGFRVPIKAAVASYIATHGSKADCESLKVAIRKAIDGADLGGRSPADIERYRSDEYLNDLIRWTRERQGDQPPKGFIPELPPGLDEPPPAEPPAVMGQGDAGVRLEDFYAYMLQHNYMYAPARDLWPGSSVNARLPWVRLVDADGNPVLDEDGEQVEIAPTAWLDKHRPVEQLTWAPGRPMIIRDRLISEGGWIERKNVGCFNLYRPPLLAHGDPDKADRWIAHVDNVYPEDAEHIRRWLAHRVQRPEEKINHALVLGGLQGIGKDSLIEPVKRAVGPWNVAEPSPVQLTGRFNGFVKSVILRISEAHDLGDIDRYQFYEHLKVYCAAPPDVLRVDEKNLREYNALNCCGVIITTNHKTDGIYLPADDRRHYVAWSCLVKEDFTQDYWNDLWGWYDSGGDRHVAAYLAQLDLSSFNPKAPPPKTAAFWDIVNASRVPEDAEMADALDHLRNPPAVTLMSVINAAASILNHDFADWLRDRKNRRIIPHRFEACGYVPVRNPDRDQGLWVIDRRRQVVYARGELSLGDQIRAAQKLRE